MSCGGCAPSPSRGGRAVLPPHRQRLPAGPGGFAVAPRCGSAASPRDDMTTTRSVFSRLCHLCLLCWGVRLSGPFLNPPSRCWLLSIPYGSGTWFLAGACARRRGDVSRLPPAGSCAAPHAARLLLPADSQGRRRARLCHAPLPPEGFSLASGFGVLLRPFEEVARLLASVWPSGSRRLPQLCRPVRVSRAAAEVRPLSPGRRSLLSLVVIFSHVSSLRVLELAGPTRADCFHRGEGFFQPLFLKIRLRPRPVPSGPSGSLMTCVRALEAAPSSLQALRSLNLFYVSVRF